MTEPMEKEKYIKELEYKLSCARAELATYRLKDLIRFKKWEEQESKKWWSLGRFFKRG